MSTDERTGVEVGGGGAEISRNGGDVAARIGPAAAVGGRFISNHRRQRRLFTACSSNSNHCSEPWVPFSYTRSANTPSGTESMPVSVPSVGGSHVSLPSGRNRTKPCCAPITPDLAMVKQSMPETDRDAPERPKPFRTAVLMRTLKRGAWVFRIRPLCTPVGGRSLTRSACAVTCAWSAALRRSGQFSVDPAPAESVD